ncbi:hypothetical protein NBRC116602_15320 [Hyphomicrobiales bacterium 4NK60-0047b]|jgi:hypothetical protein
MNWSNVALKLTIGVGSMGATAILSDPLVEWVGIYGMIAIILVPFSLLVFFKIGELADWIIKLAHLIAVLWYIALVSFALYIMQAREFQSTDIMIGTFMAIGFAPIIMVIWNMYKGKYDGAYHV